MTCGIYFYWDNEKDELAYIGKSVNCERRNREHYYHDNQKINKIIQNNPMRYNFYIMLKCLPEQLNEEEILAIQMYKPKFNFTNGGDGASYGNKNHMKQEKHRQRLSKNNPMYNKKIKDKHLKKVQDKQNRKKISETHKGKNKSEEHRKKISKAQNTSGFYRVSKHKCPTCKQGFTWRYNYYDNNGNIISINSVNIKKLEKKVKSQGLTWEKI